MAYEKNPYHFDPFDAVPDFAMQPAKKAEEDPYDPSIYDTLFSSGAAFEPAKDPGKRQPKQDVQEPFPASMEAPISRGTPKLEAAPEMPAAAPAPHTFEETQAPATAPAAASTSPTLKRPPAPGTAPEMPAATPAPQSFEETQASATAPAAAPESPTLKRPPAPGTAPEMPAAAPAPHTFEETQDPVTPELPLESSQTFATPVSVETPKLEAAPEMPAAAPAPQTFEETQAAVIAPAAAPTSPTLKRPPAPGTAPEMPAAAPAPQTFEETQAAVTASAAAPTSPESDLEGLTEPVFIPAAPDIEPTSVPSEAPSYPVSGLNPGSSEAPSTPVFEPSPAPSEAPSSPVSGLNPGSSKAPSTPTFEPSLAPSETPSSPVSGLNPDSLEAPSTPAFEPSPVPASSPTFEQSPAPAPSVTPAKGSGAKIIPVGSAMQSRHLNLTDMRKKPLIRIYLEEDILVPDVKPDLAQILSMDGSVRLSNHELSTGNGGIAGLRLTGDLILQTLYLPDHPGENESIVSIESRIPFKEDQEIKAELYSEVTVMPRLESAEYTVINERKFRVRAAVTFCVREYRQMDVPLFSGIQGEEIQMLKEKIRLTDVSRRKTETVELQEELLLKDNGPEIEKILCYDVNVVENHKQINRDKAVINASVCCNIMYLGERQKEGEEREEAWTEEGGRACMEPVFYQGTTQFTQFIRLDDWEGQTLSGSRVWFRPTEISLTPKENEEGRMNGFELSMNVDTTVELFCDMETEIISDLYHNEKELQYDTDQVSLMHFCGGGTAETSSRDIINVPEQLGNADRVTFLSACLSDGKGTVESGKAVVEGTVTVKAICMGADQQSTPFGLKQTLPFRCAVDVSEACPGMEADWDVQLKELWFDRLNNRQIQVNASLVVNVGVLNQENHQLIKNVNFVQSAEEDRERPGIVLYITRSGDNLWKVAKRYRTTVEEISAVNELTGESGIKPGTKLLIVR